jgi:nickel-type superoxide dismutase maturation protease
MAKIYLRRVVGDSMLPALVPGKLVVFLSRSHRRLVANDIVLIRHRGLEIVKRVESISPSGVFVVGDNEKHSTDSREYGNLPLDSIRGTLIWPRR